MSMINKPIVSMTIFIEFLILCQSEFVSASSPKKKAVHFFSPMIISSFTIAKEGEGYKLSLGTCSLGVIRVGRTGNRQMILLVDFNPYLLNGLEKN